MNKADVAEVQGLADEMGADFLSSLGGKEPSRKEAKQFASMFRGKARFAFKVWCKQHLAN